MKKLFAIISTIMLTACSTVKYVPVEVVKETHVHDTTYIKDTTIKYQIEKEKYTDYVGLLDTLKLSTDYATAEAYIDTTANLLKGRIESKPEKEIVIKWKEREVVRDSLVYVEKPVEVEKVVTKKEMNGFQKVFFWIGLILSLIWIIKLLLKLFAGTQFNIFGRVITL